MDFEYLGFTVEISGEVNFGDLCISVAYYEFGKILPLKIIKFN